MCSVDADLATTMLDHLRRGIYDEALGLKRAQRLSRSMLRSVDIYGKDNRDRTDHKGRTEVVGLDVSPIWNRR